MLGYPEMSGYDASQGRAWRTDASSPTGAHRASDAPASSREDAWGANPLVRAANRLLNLVPRIREAAQLQDPAELRLHILAEINAFEQRALASGVSHEEVIGARYCLCTVLDETAAQTPWGSRGVWAKHSLLVTFHNETWGGEKYYQLLARLAQSPERHRQLIELLYYCNALGYEGRFRIVENGHSQLEILKRRIATLLNQVRGGYERRLSPHWQGVDSIEPPWRLVPPWVVAAAVATVALGVFVWFLFSLGGRSDAVYAELVALRVPPPLVVEVPDPTPPPRLRRFLEAEIRAGLLEVADQSDRSIVTLTGDGLFDSGSVAVRPEYLAVLARIASALAEIDGRVKVVGHSDNVPIRSARFPSNWHLSLARAESVKTLLDGFLASSGRVYAEGRGEAEPVASNDTADGRALNRRVEITVFLSAQEIHRQINAPQVTDSGNGGLWR